jgi:hypothetical protein
LTVPLNAPFAVLAVSEFPVSEVIKPPPGRESPVVLPVIVEFFIRIFDRLVLDCKPMVFPEKTLSCTTMSWFDPAPGIDLMPVPFLMKIVSSTAATMSAPLRPSTVSPNGASVMVLLKIKSCPLVFGVKRIPDLLVPPTF